MISKIGKLLRKAARGDGPEEITSAKMARRLMDQWNIEVELTDNDDVGPQAPEVCVAVSRKSATWRSVLAAAVARLYDCDVAITSTGTVYYIHISGQSDNLLTCRLHIAHIQNQIEHALKYSPRRTWHARALGAARYVLHLIDQRAKHMDSPDSPDVDIDIHDMGIEVGSEIPDDAPTQPISTSLARLARTKIHVGTEDGQAETTDIDTTDMPESEQALGICDVVNSLRYATRPHPALGIPLGSSGIDTDTAAILQRCGHHYLGDVVALTKRQLSEIEGMTAAGVYSVGVEMRVQGLRLRPDGTPED